MFCFDLLVYYNLQFAFIVWFLRVVVMLLFVALLACCLLVFDCVVVVCVCGCLFGWEFGITACYCFTLCWCSGISLVGWLLVVCVFPVLTVVGMEDVRIWLFRGVVYVLFCVWLVTTEYLCWAC